MPDPTEADLRLVREALSGGVQALAALLAQAQERQHRATAESILNYPPHAARSWIEAAKMIRDAPLPEPADD